VKSSWPSPRQGLISRNRTRSGNGVYQELAILRATDNDWKRQRILTLGLVAANEYHQIVTTRESPKLRFIFRILALAAATCCGVFFLISFFVLAWIYLRHSPHQFPLFITTRDFVETAVFGVGFLCFGIGYLIVGP
jgi:hypothetical protein